MALTPFRVDPASPVHLVDGNGQAVFLLGDTIWEAPHRLNCDDVIRLCQERKRQGFRAVLFPALNEMTDLSQPGTSGELPLLDLNPKTPNPKFFDWIDFIIQNAADQDLYVGFLPTWGDKVTKAWGIGPVVFPLDDLSFAHDYGKYLGERYRDFPNVFWVLGGDRPASIRGLVNDFLNELCQKSGLPSDADWTPVWSAMAHGIKAGGSTALMTYHPQGGRQSTSTFIHEEDWLDFNMMQSGHGGGHDVNVWDWVERDLALTPPKPTLDGEMNYEDHPVSPWPTWDPTNGHFDDYDCRRQAWRSAFAGACGVVYGHHSVWQCCQSIETGINHAIFTWEEALTRPGAEQMRHLREFLERPSMKRWRPAQSIISGGNGETMHHARAVRGDSCAAVYFPMPNMCLSLDFGDMLPPKSAQWLNPCDGSLSDFAVSDWPVLAVTSPAPGPDSVLVMEF